MERPPTKESLLKQVDGLRDLVRRARRVAAMLSSESDQRRLERHIGELEDSALRLEQQAAEHEPRIHVAQLQQLVFVQAGEGVAFAARLVVASDTLTAHARQPLLRLGPERVEPLVQS